MKTQYTIEIAGNRVSDGVLVTKKYAAESEKSQLDAVFSIREKVEKDLLYPTIIKIEQTRRAKIPVFSK